MQEVEAAIESWSRDILQDKNEPQQDTPYGRYFDDLDSSSSYFGQTWRPMTKSTKYLSYGGFEVYTSRYISLS